MGHNGIYIYRNIYRNMYMNIYIYIYDIYIQLSLDDNPE